MNHLPHLTQLHQSDPQSMLLQSHCSARKRESFCLVLDESLGRSIALILSMTPCSHPSVSQTWPWPITQRERSWVLSQFPSLTAGYQHSSRVELVLTPQIVLRSTSPYTDKLLMTAKCNCFFYQCEGLWPNSPLHQNECMQESFTNTSKLLTPSPSPVYFSLFIIA